MKRGGRGSKNWRQVMVDIERDVDVGLSDSRYYHIYPTPPLGQDMTQGQFLKRS